MFFFEKKEDSYKEMQNILTQFNKKSLSALKDNE